ncbi:MAG: HAMP domain-containing protein [Chloroflexi bacterium]|nr:HAMP domain-containing protein [Chloroflexota bacterium]
MNEQKTEPVKPSGRFFSLRLKIWIGFILIFTPVFVASYYWFYQYTTARVFQTITDDLQETLHGTIEGIDKADFVQLYEEESTDNPMCPPEKPTADTPKEENGYYPEDNPLYMEHEYWLLAVQQVEPQTRMYTYIKGPDDGEIIAIGSTGYFREPRGGFRFCQRYTSTSSNIYNGLTAQVNAWTPYTDSFGSWITSYAPIIDDNGNAIGAIGVDIEASYIAEVRANILRNGAIAFVLSYILIFLLVFWLSGFLTRPIIGLAGVAKEIGEGDYSHEWKEDDGNPRNFRDEIDTLTGVFKVMVDKVAQREQSLRARVHQLEIMVDRSKLDKQVKEIVESDFFQDLQSKVQGMRDRFKKEE